MSTRYEVGGRYGYYAVDVFNGDQCERTAIAGVTRKLAQSIAGELSQAHKEGVLDGMVGRRYTLACDLTTPSGSDTIPAGSRVVAVDREGWCLTVRVTSKLGRGAVAKWVTPRDLK